MFEKVTYSCGHEGKIEVYGKADKRNYVISMKERDLCPECYKKQQQEITIKETKESGFPELNGSEKQIDWANQIRIKASKDLADTEKNARQWKLLKSLNRTTIETEIEEIQKEIKNYFETTTEAKEYIDNRGNYNLEFFYKKINKIIGGNKMDYREIKELEKSFDSYVEDRFVLMGKRMLKEYKENKDSKSPKLNKEQMEILADDIFTIQLATSLYSKSK